MGCGITLKHHRDMEETFQYTLRVSDDICRRMEFTMEYDELAKAQNMLAECKEDFKEQYTAWDELEVISDTPNYYEVSDWEDSCVMRIYMTKALD